MLNILSKKVLLLNSSYEPMTIVDAKKAILMMLSEKVESIEQTQYYIHSSHLKLPLPSVIKLKSYIYIKSRHIPLTRKNIIQRDNFTCQYCGKYSKNITIDHIIPRDKNGKDNWENLVAACLKCNFKKGNKLINQTNMKLLKKPTKPSYIYQLQAHVKKTNKSWKPYLFMDRN
mgnify:CR=1 FL=1|tara:strand:- start:194 stop:712 length:519 start_codon:yes stop_codon:yes gene_type:complete